MAMKPLLLAVSLAFLTVTSTAALADGKGHRHHREHDGDRGDRHPRGKHKGWHKQEYRRGAHIERVYLDNRYYVDYHDHHLSAPPPGHRWVRHPDGRYILVAVATGIIADILLHH